MMYTQTESSMQVSQRILLCPGPVMVSPRVKAALLHDDIGHREEEFSELLSRCRSKLNKIFGVTGNLYTNVIISGSGTSANEAFYLHMVQTNGCSSCPMASLVSD